MLKLTLVTPEKKFVANLEVDEVIVPGHPGQLNILSGHAPLMTTLNTGTLRYREKGASDFVEAVVSWGYCEVSPEKVLVLAETAETKDQIDVARAEDALNVARDKLEKGDLDPDEILKYQRKVKRAIERINLCKS